MNPPHPSQNYRTRRRPPLAQNSTWAGSPGWDPAGVRGRRPASGAASGRVRPRSGIRVWQTSNISLGSGMVRRGRLPSGRIRRGLGTRVLLTCPGPADPPYRGGSSSCMNPLVYENDMPSCPLPRAQILRGLENLNRTFG